MLALDLCFAVDDGDEVLGAGFGTFAAADTFSGDNVGILASAAADAVVMQNNGFMSPPPVPGRVRVEDDCND